MLCYCRHGHLLVVKRLVSAQADLTAKDKWGQTMLHLACE